MPVYLLHFNEKYHHAAHYIGFTETVEGLEKRFKLHRNGNGSRLCRVIKEAGIGFEVARVWEDGDRTFERKLKKEGHSKKHCPICIAAAKELEKKKKK